MSPACCDPSPPHYASITPLQPLTQSGGSQGNKAALVQTSLLVGHGRLSLPLVVWTVQEEKHGSLFRAAETPDTITNLKYDLPANDSFLIDVNVFLKRYKATTK